MKKLFAVLAVLILAACAEMKVAADIVDIFVPDPPPVCSHEKWGAIWNDQVCQRVSETEYKWVPLPKHNWFFQYN